MLDDGLVAVERDTYVIAADRKGSGARRVARPQLVMRDQTDHQHPRHRIDDDHDHHAIAGPQQRVRDYQVVEHAGRTGAPRAKHDLKTGATLIALVDLDLVDVFRERE